MSRRAMRQALVVFLITALAVVVTACLLVRYALSFPERPTEQPGRPVTMTVARGVAFTRLAEQLEAHGLVSSATAFRLYAHYRGLAPKVRAGTYRLSTATTPRELLDALVRGVAEPTVKVTIPEGSNINEVARILSDRGVLAASDFLAAARDRPLARRLGVPGETMEGFLYPDTFMLKKGSQASDVIETLVRQHRRVFYSLRKKYPRRTRWLRKQLGWGHHEIVTLASIVEKETGKAAERPLIASVFFNRLQRPSFQPKLLQTDPTIIYGCTVPLRKSAACQQFAGRIRRMHLRDRDNAYNTYTHPGLPPGPIANPGRAAIEAVFAPRRSRFLYFVSRNDGTHHFSATRAEHERAVDRYQRRGSGG